MTDSTLKETALEARVAALEAVVAYLMSVPLSPPNGQLLGLMPSCWSHGASAFRNVPVSDDVSDDPEVRAEISRRAGDIARQMFADSEKAVRGASNGKVPQGPWS